MFAESKPAKEHNETQLNTLHTQLILMQLIKFLRILFYHKVTIDVIKQRKMSERGNLESQFKLKIGAQDMLISNLDIDDRLVNGLVGTVKQIKYKNNEVSVVYVKFKDNNAGREAMQSDVTARQHNWVPIKNHQALFGLRKNKQRPSVKRTQFPLTRSQFG